MKLLSIYFLFMAIVILACAVALAVNATVVATTFGWTVAIGDLAIATLTLIPASVLVLMAISSWGRTKKK